MTPREMTRDLTASPGKPFTLQELLLHGKPNWAASVFFALISSLHIYLAVHAFESRQPGAQHALDTFWAGAISTLLAIVFLLVSVMCAIIRNEILICPEQRTLHLRSGFGRFSTDRALPFTAVRAVRVTLWQSKRGSKSRLEIICEGEEIPCPYTIIPRQQALYLALVMKVHLIKISDDRSRPALALGRSDAGRC